jgi:Tfp pilus assembly protein PilN
MRQQINLYQPIFSETRKPLSAVAVALVFAVLIAGLTGYSVYANMQLNQLRASVETLRSEQAEQDALLTATGEENAARERPAAVDARIKKLDRLIAERRSALLVLQSGAAGQATGFAARMEALARRHVDGLWIDKLVLSGTNGSMSLAGSTLDADTVPTYLHSLARDSVLSGTRFDEFVIERPAKTIARTEPALSEDGSESTPKKVTPAPAHIRFRAGSKTLTAPAVDLKAAT